MASLSRVLPLRRHKLVSSIAIRSFASASPWPPAPRDNPRRGIGKADLEQGTKGWSTDGPSRTPHARLEGRSRRNDANNRVNRDQASSAKQPPERRPRNPVRKMASRIIIPDVAGFYTQNGVLTTTPENAQFFRETGIESDHGQLWNITHPNANKFRKLGIEVSFSDRYVINPYHLRSFAPRGDPWAAHRRSQYKAMLAQQPLWVHSLVPFSSKPAAVRQTCTRRLAYCTRRAAELLAEEQPSVRVRGTVLIFVRDAIKAVNMPSQGFQDMMVEALRKEMKDLEDSHSFAKLKARSHSSHPTR